MPRSSFVTTPLVGHVSSMSGPDTVDYYTFYIDPGFCYQPTIEVFGFPDGAGTFNPVIYTHRIDEGCSSWGLPEASVTGEDDVYLDLACLLPGLYQFGVASQGPGGHYMLLFKCTECACGTTSLPNFDLEQNNNLCGPNNPALASGDSLWGAITNLADVDWFNFEVTEQSGETVSVSLIANGHPGFFTYGQGLNPKLFLFGNQCQSMIANDDDSGLGADAFLGPIFLPQGFYSIKVEGNGSVGPYILGTRCESCPCETCPHPNRDNEANNGSCGLDNPVVSCGQTFCGEILNPNDLDYYTFIPPQDACTWFTIRVLADDTPDQCAFGGGLDAAIDVYSANCGGLLYSEDFGGVGTDPIATFSQEYPESAYTIVVRGTANSSGRYILEVNGQPAECLEVCIVEPLPGDLFEYEYCGMSSAGNGCEGEFFSAYSIQCGESYFGYSDANEAFIDQDWYQFTVHDSNDMVAVCLESSFDAALSVIAAGPASDFCWERDLLNCTIAPQCATTCDSLCLAPGDYFFEVKPLAPYFVTCGKYRLSMKCGDCQPSRPAPIEHLTVHFPDDEYVADPERTNVVLRWEEIQGADQYLVYRTTNTDPGAIISPENLIAVTDLNRYIDESRIQNDGSTEQVYYAVVVRFLTSAPPCDSGN
ncbi:MAG: hypothetical protein IPK53_00320 [bacterium]|nr:hypothetical protein [bacterium]